MEIKAICEPSEKRAIARRILESLPDWFGVEESRERYVAQCAEQPFFAAFDGGSAVGFTCLKPTGKDTAELAVMGVLPEYHRRGAGRLLVERLKRAAGDAGYSFLQVKTVKMGVYEDYDRTNRFYQAMGFREFEVFPTLWDEANPCQIYVMALNG